MRHAPSTLHFSFAFRQPAPAGAIEWEELPSLAGALADRLENRHFGKDNGIDDSRLVKPSSTVWDSTRPADLEVAVTSGPFREPMNGMAIREVEEPDVFRHFFGR